MERLRECPFCGGDGHMNVDTVGYYVQCMICDAKGPHGLSYESKSNMAEAVHYWNRRRDGKPA